MPFHLCTVCGFFHAAVAEKVVAMGTTKPKIFTTGPLQKKSLPTLV